MKVVDDQLALSRACRHGDPDPFLEPSLSHAIHGQADRLNDGDAANFPLCDPERNQGFCAGFPRRDGLRG
jgi:hypothetical protein